MAHLVWKLPLRIISDGVYYIRNNYSQKYLHVPDGSITPLTAVCQNSKVSTTGIIPLKQMWKIYYLGSGRYSVRPMHKLDMGLDVCGIYTAIDTIGTTDTSSGVQSTSKWYITSTANGYRFAGNSAGTKTMALESNSTADGIEIAIQSDSGLERQRWSFEKVANPPSGVIMYTQGTAWGYMADRWISPNGVETHTSLEMAPTFFSGTDISQNFNWVSGNTDIVRVNASTGTVTGLAPGYSAVVGTKTYNGETYRVINRVNVTEIEEGEYFLQNVETGKYVDIENQTMSIGTILHQWQFHSGNTQRWEFILNHNDGFFSILSKNSTENTPYYMKVKNSTSESDASIGLGVSPYEPGAKWRVSTSSSNNVVLTSNLALSSGCVLSIQSNSTENGIDLRQKSYEDDTDYTDEWIFAKINVIANVSLEGQKKSNWCWVTTARMFSKHYFPNITKSQSQAVEKIFGNDDNHAGSPSKADKAISYFVSSVSDETLQTTVNVDKVYSQGLLRRFLDEGNVIYISRGLYLNRNNKASRYSGHAYLIYGYVSIGYRYRFLVRDPLPVNTGSTYMISYEKLFDGQDNQWLETADTGIWDGNIVVTNSYSGTTEPNFFG